VPPLAVVVALSTPAIASLVRRSHTALIVTGAAVVVGMAIAWLARHRLRAHVASIWTRTGHLRIGPAPAARAVCCATLAQVETIARQIVVAAAFGVPLTIQQSATITIMGIVGGFVPTVGSVGAIDGSMVAGLMLFGATVEAAAAITIVGRVISYGVSTAAGAVALALLGGRGILRGRQDRLQDVVARRVQSL